MQVQEPSQPEDVSPLSPQTSQQQVRDERPISPIEPLVPRQARAPLPERSLPSQIPRKASGLQGEGKSETRWDEYSGEPTNDQRGKPASVRPGSQSVEMQYPHLKERTKQILAGIRERETAKKKPWGKPPPPVADDPLDNPPEREPWRGASGRAAIVEPVRNTPSARKGPVQAQHPERRSSRVPAEANAPTAAFHSAVTEPQTQEPSVPRPTLRASPSAASIKPVVPLKTRNLTPDLNRTSPTQSPVERTPVQSPTSPTASAEIHLNGPVLYPEALQTRVESPQYDPEPTTPTTPTPIPATHNDKFSDTPASYPPADFEREQSRFSWTTYTTSTMESPRSMAQVVRDSSPPPAMPDLPAGIKIKKRPVSSSPFMHSHPYMHQQFVNSTGSVVRKPVPSVNASNASVATAASRAVSTSKSLPPTPTVMEAADKIENLAAQLESLQRRKHNVTRIIGDLESSLRRNAVIYDMWKRREVEKNIINHKMSLDEITSDIHEISIQMHRAQRKRDQQDGVQATGLWIKRVTS